MMTDGDEIAKHYEVLALFYSKVVCNAGVLLKIQDTLQPVKDIKVTLNRLALGAVLDEIQLFEIKRVALVWEKVRRLLIETAGQIEMLGTSESLEDVVDVLDPEKLRIESFYIYDCYSPSLAKIRHRLKISPEDVNLLADEKEEEHAILIQLAGKLKPAAKRLEKALDSLAEIDINCAVADYMQHGSLCIPKISGTGKSMIVGYSNPEVESQVEKEGGIYQYCDIVFKRGVPTIVIGANMGGKSVTLKTVALCQYLLQFALPLPACNATLCVEEKIYLITPEERPSSALSSFGNEMKEIDSMLRSTGNGEKSLVILDEPCRSTNPVEGSAMVEALADLTARRKNVTLILATHYCILPVEECRWLRVIGIENGKMNYALVESSDREIPQEALNVASQLGVDEEWLGLAKKILNDK
jgi:DNA mismatch repair ATPase MutS